MFEIKEEDKEKVEKLINDIKETELKINLSENMHLIQLFYRIGEFVSKSSDAKIIEKLFVKLRLEHSKEKYFDINNLDLMRRFYEEYATDEETVRKLSRLSWEHVTILIKYVKDKKNRIWYIEKCLEEYWSSGDLLTCICEDVEK